MRAGMTGGDLSQFEGLIFRTSRMYSARVGIEEEDLAQILRIKAWQAMVSYDSERARQPVKAYVFSCITNKVKDLKRDAARRNEWRCAHSGCSGHAPAPASGRADCPECGRPLHAQGEHYIEDMAGPSMAFEARYMTEGEDEAFASVEDHFDLPSSLTEIERRVVILLALDYAQIEIAVMLKMRRPEVKETRDRVREKMADWRPSTSADVREPVAA